MKFLEFLTRIEQTSDAFEKIHGKGRPSWIVPTAAVVMFFGTVWQGPALTEAYTSARLRLDSAERANAVPLVIDDNPVGLNMSPLAEVTIANNIQGPASEVNLDPYLPSTWTDTIHYDGMDTELSVAASSCGSGCSNEGPGGAYTVSVSQTGMTHGGRLSGYTPSNRLVDTFTVDFDDPNAAPGVWYEHSHGNNTGGGSVNLQLQFADGNGSGTTNVDRVYVRITTFLEDPDSVPFHVNGYVENSASNKFASNPAPGSELLVQVWQGIFAFDFLNSATKGPWGNADTCDNLWPNTWRFYYPSDTLPGGGRPWWKDTSCRHPDSGMDTIPAGNVGFVPGRVQHWWYCIDSSGAQDIVSWGVTEEDRQGIAGYWGAMPAYSSGGVDVDAPETLDGVYRNTTYGGSPPNTPHAQSQYTGAILVVTGTTGSCVVPPF